MQLVDAANSIVERRGVKMSSAASGYCCLCEEREQLLHSNGNKADADHAEAKHAEANHAEAENPGSCSVYSMMQLVFSDGRHDQSEGRQHFQAQSKSLEDAWVLRHENNKTLVCFARYLSVK